jgi:hypothetical protein
MTKGSSNERECKGVAGITLLFGVFGISGSAYSLVQFVLTGTYDISKNTNCGLRII